MKKALTALPALLIAAALAVSGACGGAGAPGPVSGDAASTMSGPDTPGPSSPPVVSPARAVAAVTRDLKEIDRIQRLEIAPREQERVALSDLVSAVTGPVKKSRAGEPTGGGAGMEQQVETIRERIRTLDGELAALYAEQEVVREDLRAVLNAGSAPELPEGLKAMVVAQIAATPPSTGQAGPAGRKD